MIHYDYYADVPDDAVLELVRSSRLGRLVTVGNGDFPHLGLYPFTHDEGLFEIHLNRMDEQIADLRVQPRCLFEMDEVLATIPSHWIHPENASFATAYHRTVTFECIATLIEDPASIAAQQKRILSRYQPEGRHSDVNAQDPMYAGMVRALVGVRLEVSARKIKFKLGQNRDLDTRAKLVTHLRERGTEVDLRSADALQWTIDLGWTTRGRTR